jgi:aryl-alcohol dehydrogenase-like predicted oxidoreductase
MAFSTTMLRSSPVVASQHWQPSRRQALASTTAAAAWASTSSSSSGKIMAAQAADLPLVPKTEIIPGLEISRVVKGCWQLSGGHAGDKATDRTSGKAAVSDFQAFVDAGITTYDTADIYGPSERIIGEYLSSLTPEARSKCQVLTKFCCFGDSMRQANKLDFVSKSINNSCSNLRTDVLDCVQFYWHDYSNKNYVDAALHLAELQSKGKIKAIGVTNFDVPRLQEMVDAGVPIVENQIQYSLLDTRPDNGMTQYCLEKGIRIVPYGTAAGKFLTDAYLGKKPSDVSVNTYSLSKYASVISQRGGWEWYQSLLAVLRDVATKHNVDVAEVSSRWVLQRPAVAAVIVGARNASHVEQHRKIFSFELDGDDLAKIEAVLNTGNKPTSDVYSWERGGRWA